MANSKKFEREDLEKFLNFIEDIASQQGNDWFGKSLIQRIGNRYAPVGSSASSDSLSQIREIHEYCIAEVLERQSREMYKGIQWDDLRETLIADFISMEKFRREDDFDNFCRSLFLQVEAMINYVLKLNPNYKKRAELDFEQPAFSRFDKKENRWNRTEGKIVAEYLFGSSGKKGEPPSMETMMERMDREVGKWEVFQRLKLMVYYYVFDGKMNYSMVEKEFKVFLKLKDLRDEASHRHSSTPEYKQESVAGSRSDRMKYYIEFMSFLQKMGEWVMQKGS